MSACQVRSVIWPLTPDQPYRFMWGYNPAHTTAEEASRLGREHLRGLVNAGMMPEGMLAGFREHDTPHFETGMRLAIFERMPDGSVV